MKCENCQFKEQADVECIAEKHKRLCELKENRPEYQEIIRARSLGLNIEYPSTPEQVKNATMALIDAAKAVFKGEALSVSDEEVANRLKICESCEYYDMDQNRCKKCGCGLELKTRLSTAHCPLDPPKW